MPYSSGGRPVNAWSPTFGMCRSRNFHASVPSSRCSMWGATSRYFAGRWCSNTSGGSTTWSSTLTRMRSSVRIARAYAPDMRSDTGVRYVPPSKGGAVKRRVCVVGVGLSDGPVTPEMSGTMLEAQSFRRALDDAGLEKSDIEGLASAGYGGMHEVMLAEYLGLTPTWLESSSTGGSSFEFHTMHAFR